MAAEIPRAAAIQHRSVLRKIQPVENGGGYVEKPRETQPAVSKIVRQCSLCSKEATYLCSGCRGVWYCGKDCQVRIRVSCTWYNYKDPFHIRQ